MSRKSPGKDLRSRRGKLGAAIAVAATSEIIFLAPAYASDDRSMADGWGALPIRSVMIGAQGSASVAQTPPERENAQIADSSGGGTTSPELQNAQSAMKADARALGPISQTLHSFQMTGAQDIAVRNYIGQYSEKTKVVPAGTFNGVTVFGIRDAKTGDYTGEVELRAGANGEIIVSKISAAEFDTKKKFELPLAGKVDDEEAQQVLGGSSAYQALSTEEKKPSFDAELPAVLNAERGTTYGVANEATAHFYPDGSGYEFGYTTKIASAQGEAKLGASGVSAGVGARGPEVEGFANYFGSPQQDDAGKFSHSVFGGTANIHSTLAELQAKYGCDENEPCSAKFDAGLLGVGAGLGLVLSPHVDIPVRPENEIAEGGIATPPPPPPAPSANEQSAYDDAIKSGDMAQLEQFLTQYPDSALDDEAENQIDYHAAASPDQPMPVTGY